MQQEELDDNRQSTMQPKGSFIGGPKEYYDWRFL
jgi:hypothetical protein